MLKHSAEDADGWIASGQGTTAAFREIWQQVYGYAPAAGKAPDTLDAGKLMYISVGTDRERCGAQLRAFTLTYHGRSVT